MAVAVDVETILSRASTRLVAVLNLSVVGFSFVVFHDKAKRTQQGNLLLFPLVRIGLVQIAR